jgi:D-alanyl-lipoteichoic acid acyltransferase DltB (MBOAT superfamily)
MLFNSYAFLFIYLPVTVSVFFVIGRFSNVVAAAWLALASLAFYAYWNPVYVLLLLVSIGFNFALGLGLIAHARSARGRRLLAMAVIADLGLLGYYKYANFFVESVNAVSGAGWTLEQVVLPLGISFFTFTQIAFLVDAYRGEVKERRFVHYVLFVTYFPHLIAGPVLHHKEMMPQFSDDATYRPNAGNFAVGLTIFIIGLAKKVLLADNVAIYVAPVFDAAAQGRPLTMLEAWGGTLAYTLQLYFDFSGYSDMAIGLSRLFGIRLPLNFASPYKAANIIEFWRRWHMTLSRFLRDYLYIALGGNRRGRLRRHLNLLATMVLGGLWHGAGWTFVVWGALHGVFLVANHAWQGLRSKWRPGLRAGLAGHVAAVALTFLCVVVAWVFFRAPTLPAAMTVLEGMAGVNGVVLPAGWRESLPPALYDALRALGLRFGDPGQFKGAAQLAWIAALLAVAWFTPNTQQWLAAWKPALDASSAPASAAPAIAWRPTRIWAVPMAMLAALVLASLGRVSEFLYFQF